MGNRSSGRDVAQNGVRRTSVLLPGFLVQGTLRLPSAHPYAPWLLAYVERLLQGATLAELQALPPWPVPADPLVVRQLVRTLLDERWLVPDWTSGTVAVSAELAARYRRGGRAALAEVLAQVDEHEGEWWMEGLGGTLFRRQTAAQFDYDIGRKPRADLTIDAPADPDALLAAAPVDVPALLVMLGGSLLYEAGRDRARLAAPLQVASRKDIFFPLFGERVRILPAELGALEPVFTRLAPHFFEDRHARPVPTSRALATAPPRAAQSATVPTRAPASALATAPAPATASAPTAATQPASQAGPVDPLVQRVRADMVLIPAGRFLMGDRRVPKESPPHWVSISRSFWLGKTPVTQGLWQEVMGKLPFLRDGERHPNYPVIYVGYREILRFIDQLNTRPGGGGFTLPTEAQWEYACRAGSTTAYCFGDNPGPGDGPGLLEQYAWTRRSGKAGLSRVGLLKPNAFGLHDMHGLVYETMRDGPRVYDSTEVVDPIGPTGAAASEIVARGGSWGKSPVPRSPAQDHLRCASRQVHESSHRVGFRLAFEGNP